MSDALFNGAAILAYLLIGRYMLTYMKRVKARQIRNHLSRKQFTYLCLAVGLLLIKFWNLGDAVLIAGQLCLLGLLGVFGLQRRQAARKAKSAKRIVVSDGHPAKAAVQPAVPKPQVKDPKRRKKRWLVAGLALLLLAAAAIRTYELLSAPNEGQIQSPATAEQEVAAKPLTLQGKYFSLEYPEGFTKYPTDPPRPPFLETHDLIRRQDGIGELTVQVETLPSGNLSDDGSYNLRKVHTDRYTETVATINGQQVRIMDEKGALSGFSRSAFIVHDGKLGIVTLTGGGDDIEDIFEAVLKSWRWK